MNEAIAAVRDSRDRSLDPVFCATGGFKAEIAFLNLLGALLAVEVFYIHEKFREVIRLPHLPLTWDADWVLQRRQFFEWIDDEPRSSTEVASRLKADPALQRSSKTPRTDIPTSMRQGYSSFALLAR